MDEIHDLPAPHERADIVLRPAEGATPNPPDILHELARMVHKLLPDVQEAAHWTLLRGKRKDEAEFAKIKADIIEKIGRLDLDRQRLIQERDAAVLKEDHIYEENMEALKIKKIEVKAEAAGKLFAAYASALEKGVVFDAKVTKVMVTNLADALNVDS